MNLQYLQDESTVSGLVGDDESMFSASSPVYQKMIYTLTALICIASCIGIAITMLNFMKNKRLKIQNELTSMISYVLIT